MSVGNPLPSAGAHARCGSVHRHAIGSTAGRGGLSRGVRGWQLCPAPMRISAPLLVLSLCACTPVPPRVPPPPSAARTTPADPFLPESRPLFDDCTPLPNGGAERAYRCGDTTAWVAESASWTPAEALRSGVGAGAGEVGAPCARGPRGIAAGGAAGGHGAILRVRGRGVPGRRLPRHRLGGRGTHAPGGVHGARG